MLACTHRMEVASDVLRHASEWFAHELILHHVKEDRNRSLA